MNNTTITSLFQSVVTQHPEVIAVEYQESRVTFQELNRFADQVAQNLHITHGGINRGEVVGVYLGSSIEYVASILGIMKAGGCFLPLDVSMSWKHNEHIIKSSKLRFILTTSQYMADLAPISRSQVTVLGVDQVFHHHTTPFHSQHSTTDHNLTGQDIAYVIFTSGSTGVPNGVMVPHQGVCNLVDFNKNLFNLQQNTRILQYASVSFDASIFEIFSSVLTGCTLVIAERDHILPGPSMVRFLNEKQVNVILLPPSSLSLMNMDAPALTHLTTILVGGEKCPASIPKVWVNENRQVYNAYGPTEASVYATIHKIQKEEGDSVPIGKALPGFDLKVLDDELNHVGVNSIGELFIGGKGTAKGYLHNESLTEERFISIAGEKYFRTKDLVRLLADGSFEFLGRKDNQVKIRGFRVDPEVIENVLSKHPEVKCCVIIARDDMVPNQKALVAFVVPGAQCTEGNFVKSLRRYAKTELAVYMQPSMYVVCDKLPLMSNGGKVDRKFLSTVAVKNVKESAAETPVCETSSPVCSRIAQIFESVLRIQNVKQSDNFFELGGDSLLAASLIRKIESAFDIQLPASLIFSKPTPKLLADALETSNFNRTSMIEVIDYLEEAKLPEDIAFNTVQAPLTLNFAQDSVSMFITGSTGFLGGHLLAELLSKNSNAVAFCLIRAKDYKEGTERVKDNLKSLNIWEHGFDKRIVAVPGSLELRNLGIEDTIYYELARSIDIIYHMGADISYLKSFSALKGANVTGTQEILRLATIAERHVPVHYCSSMCVYGSSGNFFVDVKEISESDNFEASMPYLNVETGYVKSKWVSEYLVRNAIKQGIPVTIYRPGFILGSSKTGIPNKTDFLYRLFNGCIQMGVFPDLPNQYWLPVTVDYVASAIAHISMVPGEKRSDTYNIVPGRSKEVSVVGMFAYLQEMGFSLQKVSLQCWLEEVSMLEDEANSLYSVSSYILDKVHLGRNTIMELNYCTPDCKSDLLEQALAGTGITCPAFDINMMGLMASHFTCGSSFS